MEIPREFVIARMMTTDRDKVSKTAARAVAIIQEAMPDLTRARDLLDRFHPIIQNRKNRRLRQWIEDASQGHMKSFVSGIVQE